MLLIALWCLGLFLFIPKTSPADEPDINSLIYTTAVKYHIKPELLRKIAKCESNFNPVAQNPRSTASGIFQFINSTFINQANAYGLPVGNKNDPNVQIELAAEMIADGKIGHWKASRDCWSK